MKIETHLHTAECDIFAHVKAKEAVRMYKEAGYDCIVVTDHYFSLFFDWFSDELSGKTHEEMIQRWLRGYHNARNEGERLGVTVLPGAEVRFDNTINDYLVYGVDENFFLHAPRLNTLASVSELISVLPNDACVVQAHPFRNKMTVEDPSPLFGIEVHNGGTDAFRNSMARTFAEHYGKAMLSGSDFHKEQHLARGGIECDRDIKTPADLSTLLRSENYKLL